MGYALKGLKSAMWGAEMWCTWYLAIPKLWFCEEENEMIKQLQEEDLCFSQENQSAADKNKVSGVRENRRPS